MVLERPCVFIDWRRRANALLAQNKKYNKVTKSAKENRMRYNRKHTINTKNNTQEKIKTEMKEMKLSK